MQKIDLSQPNIERLQLNSDRLEALARATIMSGDQADILAEKTKNFKEPTTLDEFYKFADSVAPLGNASAESCADYCITLFSDLTRMVTMQNLFHDGGYSSTGASMEAILKFEND